MIEPLQYQPIIEKLFEKTASGRVPWEENGQDKFRCDLDQYKFFVWRSDDGYGLRTEDEFQRVLFLVRAEEEIIYRDPEKERLFQLLSDMFELARRKALNVPDKLAGVAQLLDRI
jgi:hypothetical protein